MEPMTLGSPVGSPVSSPQMLSHPLGNTHSISIPTSTYYPSYLMGDSLINSGRIPPGSISPGRPRQFSSTAISSPSTPQVSRENYFPTTQLGNDRPGGPPTLSLMGGLPQSPASRIQNVSFLEQQKLINSPNSQYNSPGMHPGTPGVSDLLNTTSSLVPLDCQLREPIENTWVTVYGFPVASGSYILTQFAQLGTIVDQKHPGIGNWMHLKYQTKMQARKALSKNSKIFNGNIMVGVVPCTDPTIVQKENISMNASTLLSPNESIQPTTPKSNIRPLTQAYEASRAEFEVTPTACTPKKNDGLVAKAMQHLLGI